MELASEWHSVVLLSIITEGVRGRFSGNRGKSPLIGKWLGMFEGLKKNGWRLLRSSVYKKKLEGRQEPHRGKKQAVCVLIP